MGWMDGENEEKAGVPLLQVLTGPPGIAPDVAHLYVACRVASDLNHHQGGAWPNLLSIPSTSSKFILLFTGDLVSLVTSPSMR